jgi:quercetin 2,3-dioxygenase
MNFRKIKRISHGIPTREGAGVHLKRIFGYHDVPAFDPFLLLDDFRNSDPKNYIEGFPWHPHRGIETITYVLEGDVEHGDSLGNKGVISSGDVQWMTAGSGIIHQEMPKGNPEGIMDGFQLWTNLPSSQKMMNPRYRDIKSFQIPEISLKNDVKIKIICGKVDNVTGPVTGIITDPEYLDITIPPGNEYIHETKEGHTVFAYIIMGNGYFSPDVFEKADNGTLILYEEGNHISIHTKDESVRFLLISGKPIGETVAWYGPIVMNTDEEIEIALNEYRNETFIK